MMFVSILENKDVENSESFIVCPSLLGISSVPLNSSRVLVPDCLI